MIPTATISRAQIGARKVREAAIGGGPPTPWDVCLLVSVRSHCFRPARSRPAISAKTYLQRDGRFRIAGASHIQAVGLTEVTRAQLLPVFGEDIGRNIFFVPLNVRRKELEAIPWIQQATVMRLLPDQIRIDIVERKPVAFTRHGQQIGLVDANGVLLDMAPAAMAAHHYSFPVLTGIDPGDKPASRAGAHGRLSAD